MLALVTKFLGARALKAVVGGITTTAIAGAFTEGFSAGLTPFAHNLGAQIATAIGTFIVGHIAVYLPRNKPDAK
jgi:hypothetical protein